MLDAKRHILPVRGTGILTTLLRSTAGTILPMLAFMMLILMALIGGGVDMARGYKAERRLQAACDAGVLAGRRTITTAGLDAASIARAREYFTANFDNVEQDVRDVVFTPTSPDNGDTVEGVASGNLRTLIVAVFGFTQIPISVECSASMGMGNADIMFVLDNTGSMAWKPDGSTTSDASQTRIRALQNAMKSFRDTVGASMEASNARVRYGFVPYSSTVRVGQVIHDLNPAYLRNTVTVQSLRLVNWPTAATRTWTDSVITDGPASYSNWTQHSTTKYTTSACVNSSNASQVPPDTAWANSGSMTFDTSSKDIDDTTGEQIKTTGTHQPQSMTDYECIKYAKNEYYVYKRTGTRDRKGTNYEARTANNVTSAGANFTNAVLQARDFDVSAYKNFTSMTLPIGIKNSSDPDQSVNVTMTWNGCIQERQTVTDASFAFVDLLTGITPSGAIDLDIDAEPTADPATQWGPMITSGVYFRDGDVAFENLDDSANGNVSDSEIEENQASSACPQAARTFAEMDESQFDTYVDSLTPSGSTYHDTGLLWGARLSSPFGMWENLVNEEADNGATVSRHLIFMTDGELDTDRYINAMYGIERHDKRITGTGTSDSGQLSRHRSRYLALCEAIKARGIRLWVIAFGSGVTLSDELELRSDEPGDTGCSSPDSAYRAADASALNTAFQEIANQVGELRVTQ